MPRATPLPASPRTLERRMYRSDDAGLGVAMFAARRGFLDQLAADQLVEAYVFRDRPEVVEGGVAMCRFTHDVVESSSRSR